MLMLAVVALVLFVAVESGELTIHVNNCLEEMTFVGCRDVIGNFSSQPSETIAQYSRGEWVLNLSDDKETQGNCTYQYTNSHGTWTAFFDWEYQTLGSANFGGGTNDVIDSEITDISCGRTDMTCFWLYYESEGEMDCTYQTDDADCKPCQDTNASNGFKITHRGTYVSKKKL